MVEHHVANVIVEGSIPFARSIFFSLLPPLSPSFSPDMEIHIAFPCGGVKAEIYCPLENETRMLENAIWRMKQ